MITVTRLNGQEIALNPDLIFSIEETPDTVITLTTGDKYVLRDPMKVVIERFIAYKNQIHTQEPASLGALTPR